MTLCPSIHGCVLSTFFFLHVPFPCHTAPRHAPSGLRYSLLCLPCGAALPSHANHPVPPGHAHGNFHLLVAVCTGRCNFPRWLSAGVKMLSGPMGFLPMSYHGVGLNKRRSASDRKMKTRSIVQYRNWAQICLKDSG